MRIRGIAFRLTLLLIFTIPWEQTAELPGRGTITKLVGVGAGVAWFLGVMADGRQRRPDRFHAAFFLMVVWIGLTVHWSLDPRSTIKGFLTFVQLLILLLMLWDLVDTQERVRLALQAYVAGAFVSIGGILVNFLNDQTTVYLRYSAPGYDVDGSGLILALGMPAAIYLALSGGAEKRSAALRFLDFAYVPAAIFAIVLTATRTAAIASLPTVVFAVLYAARSRPSLRVAAAAALSCGIYLLVTFAPAASVDRIALSTKELSQESSTWGDSFTTGRTGIWQESVQAFLKRPLGGVGHGAHREAIASGKVAHNTPLSILTETGMIGFALFATVVACVVGWVRRLTGWEARYWITQLAVVMLGAMTLSVEHLKAVWLLVGLAVASAALAARHEAEPAFHARTLPLPARTDSFGQTPPAPAPQISAASVRSPTWQSLPQRGDMDERRRGN